MIFFSWILNLDCILSIKHFVFPHPKPDAEFMMASMDPIFSEPGSLRRQKESKIVNYLQDFIQSIEDEGDTIALKFYEPICSL